MGKKKKSLQFIRYLTRDLGMRTGTRTNVPVDQRDSDMCKESGDAAMNVT